MQALGLNLLKKLEHNIKTIGRKVEKNLNIQ